MGGEARILRFADARRTLWRNGGGSTVELAAAFPGVGADAFAWRVSLASVERDGPFSSFPGVDRILTVLDGNGMDLAIGSGPAKRLTPESPPFRFPGEVPCSCRVPGGSVLALNAMVRRDAFSCDVVRLEPTADAPHTLVGLQVAICAAGGIDTEIGILGPRDALLVPAGASIPVRLTPDTARAVLILIRPASGSYCP